MSLPLNLNLSMMQTKWKAQLDPVLSNPFCSANILENINLKSGVNVINHLLGRVQQGWFLVDKQAASDIYRSAPFNNLTLTLTSTADVTVSIGVF